MSQLKRCRSPLHKVHGSVHPTVGLDLFYFHWDWFKQWSHGRSFRLKTKFLFFSSVSFINEPLIDPFQSTIDLSSHRFFFSFGGIRISFKMFHEKPTLLQTKWLSFNNPERWQQVANTLKKIKRQILLFYVFRLVNFKSFL